MKSEAQLDATIARFAEVFWAKRSGGRPPVGVVDPRVFTPIQYLRRPLTHPELLPEEVDAGLACHDYEFGFARRSVTSDDYLPFVAAWRAVPWLEAICGCPVRCAEGSLAPGHWAARVGDLANLHFSAAWRGALERETRRLVAQAPPDCWVSPTILRGPSDVLAALRGLTAFYCDLHDAPAALHQAAARVHEGYVDFLDLHFSLVAPRRGGYGHIYGYWAPEPTIVIQEDVLGMCAPARYRDLFRVFNEALVRRLGAYVLFHLHSTGCRHYREVLAIPGLAGIELTVEANGPALPALVPMLREILEHSRLMLFVDHGFEHLRDALRRLPHEGLYLIIPDRDLPDEAAFRAFVERL